MAKKPGVTLNEVRRNLPQAKDKLRASDLMDADRLAKLRAAAKQKSAQKKKLFDGVDAIGAEIIARFGYEVYEKWNSGGIEMGQMMRWIHAERAREKATLVDLEAIIIAMTGACIRRKKGDPKPKGPSVANKIYKKNVRQAKGEE